MLILPLTKKDLDIFCIEFHLELNYVAADLLDFRMLEPPFKSEYLFNLLLEINKRRNPLG